MKIYRQKLKDDLAKVKSASLSQSMKPEMVALRNEVMSVTHWMTEGTPIAARVKAILQDLVEIPDCMCGNKCGLDKSYTNVFQKFCSAECNQTYSRLSPDAAKKLYDYDWLYEQRYTLKKSKDQIAEEIGTSSVAVSNAIKRFDMTPVRYNEADTEIQEFLKDGEFIKKEYAAGNPVSVIAKKANCGEGIIYKYMKIHGIEAREPNSYERKPMRCSAEEKEFAAYIMNVYSGESKIGKKKISGQNYDVDLYLPKLNLAFEYNGLYHHKFVPNATPHAIRKDATYHLGKTIYAKNNGIRLVHVYSDLWANKRHIVESVIRHAVGKTENKIHARKCKFVSIDKSNTDMFLAQNNVFGSCDFDICYGLFFDEKLVSVAAFKHNNGGWVMVRFCTKTNTSVVGGVSKLISNFKRNHNGKLRTNVDYALYDGNTLLKCGFSQTTSTQPFEWNTNFTQRWKDEENRGKRATFFDCGELVFEIM